MPQDYEQLKSDVAELKKWKDARTQQQITYPLDFQSQTVLNKYFLSKVGDITYSAGSAGGFFRLVLVEQNGQTEALEAVALLTRYTAVPSTDFVTVASGSFMNGQQVIVISTSLPPAPLVSGNVYFVVSATSDGRSFKLSLTLGGAAINITNTGSGQQYLYFFT